MSNTEYKVLLATTEEEKEAIYKLRYHIYIEEFKYKVNSANYERKIIKDCLDEQGVQFYAVSCKTGGIVAVARCNLLKNEKIDIINDSLVKELYKEYYPDRISATSRVFVVAEFRKTLAFPVLLANMYLKGIEENIALNFIVGGISKIKFYEKLGYKYYTESFYNPEYDEMIYPMVINFEEKEYLKSIRSPLIRLCEK